MEGNAKKKRGLHLCVALSAYRLVCQPNPNQPNPSRCYTSSFKFSLSPPTSPGEVSNYLTLRLHCPEKSNWIALSRIQLRGNYRVFGQINIHFFLGYSIGNWNEAESAAAPHLPLMIVLQLLAHCLKFTKVLLKTNQTPNLIFFARSKFSWPANLHQYLLLQPSFHIFPLPLTGLFRTFFSGNSRISCFFFKKTSNWCLAYRGTVTLCCKPFWITCSQRGKVHTTLSLLVVCATSS